MDPGGFARRRRWVAAGGTAAAINVSSGVGCLHRAPKGDTQMEAAAFWKRVKHAAETDRKERERRSEEHTSELQSHSDLVCRLLLEKKKKKKNKNNKRNYSYTKNERRKTTKRN